MESNTINPYVVSTTQYEHVVKYADGTKRIARLFYSSDGFLCEFNRRSRKWGRHFDTRGVVSVEPQVKRHIDDATRARKFMTKVCAILEKSGLWANILYDFRVVLNLDDETLGKIVRGEIEYEERHELANKLGLKCGSVNCGFDSLNSTIKKGIKSINYNSWEKQGLRERFARAIAERSEEEYGHFWRKGYDNRIGCKMCADGVMRAWYSEEFKDCGNGHYYIAIDERHALYGEDD